MWPWFMTDSYDEVWNYGRSGAGNEYIFLAFLDALNKHNIHNEDTVVLAWSTYARIDLYNKDGWQTHGNIFNNYDNDFIDKIWNPTAAVDKTWRYINAATELLLGRGVKFIHTSLDNLDAIDTDIIHENQNYNNIYNLNEIRKKRYISNNTISHFTEIPLQPYANNNQHNDDLTFLDNANQRPRGDGHPRTHISSGIARDLIKPALRVQHSQKMDIVACDINQHMCELGTILLPKFVNIINEVWKWDKPLTKYSLPKYLDLLDNYVKQGLNNS
jgi:hypothetical protein